MTPLLLLLAAVLLIAFGGLMAAIDAALGVTSRQGIAELGLSGRNAQALRRIADDPDAHANAVVFIRVLAETTAAVLVTVALMAASALPRAGAVSLLGAHCRRAPELS